MSKPQIKRINIYDSTQHRDPPENLNDYIDWCKDKFNSIPEEYRSTARIETDYDIFYNGCGGEQGFAFVTINYWRDETEGERFEREAKQIIRDRKTKEQRKREYDLLKKEFE